MERVNLNFHFEGIIGIIRHISAEMYVSIIEMYLVTILMYTDGHKAISSRCNRYSGEKELETPHQKA